MQYFNLLFVFLLFSYFETFEHIYLATFVCIAAMWMITPSLLPGVA